MKRQIIAMMFACVFWAVGFSQAASSLPPGPIPPGQQEQQGPQPPELLVRAHIQNMGPGFPATGRAGVWVGTRGKGLRLEAFQVRFNPAQREIGFEYMCHIQGKGDTRWIGEGNTCGTMGEGRQIEGFAIRLTGNGARRYTVRYQCHIERMGDLPTVADGRYCGTRGQGLQLEQMRVLVASTTGKPEF